MTPRAGGVDVVVHRCFALDAPDHRWRDGPPARRDRDEDTLTFLLRTSSVRLGKWEISVPRTAFGFRDRLTRGGSGP